MTKKITKKKLSARKLSGKDWIIIIAAFLVYSASATVIFWPDRGAETAETASTGELIAILASVVALVVLLCYLLVIRLYKRARALRSCDDPLFDEIDLYHCAFGENDAGYAMMIQIINLYYEDNGKVDELVKNRQFSRLYARDDFLKSKPNFDSEALNILYSFVISIMASVTISVGTVFSNGEPGNTKAELFIWSSGLAIAFFLIICFIARLVVEKYSTGVQKRPHKDYLYEYERKLLAEKIEKAEMSLRIETEDEKALITKKTVLNELKAASKKAKIKKRKKEIDTDISSLEKLDLFIRTDQKYQSYKYRQEEINGNPVFFPYNTAAKRQDRLKSGDYKTLDDIMDKYKIIYEKKQEEK